MRPHKNLKVWKKAIEFVTRVYEIIGLFPTEEELGLISQIRRSGISFPSNIAESPARDSREELIRLLSIAQGTTSELETQLVISNNLGFLKRHEMR
jgi:four helix bundle protein